MAGQPALSLQALSPIARRGLRRAAATYVRPKVLWNSTNFQGNQQSVSQSVQLQLAWQPPATGTTCDMLCGCLSLLSLRKASKSYSLAPQQHAVLNIDMDHAARRGRGRGGRGGRGRGGRGGRRGGREARAPSSPTYQKMDVVQQPEPPSASSPQWPGGVNREWVNSAATPPCRYGAGCTRAGCWYV